MFWKKETKEIITQDAIIKKTFPNLNNEKKNVAEIQFSKTHILMSLKRCVCYAAKVLMPRDVLKTVKYH